MDDKRSSTVTTQSTDQAEGVVRSETEVISDGPARVALWEETIKEWPDDTVAELLVIQRKRERKQRSSELEALLRIVGVPQVKPSASILFDGCHLRSVQPNGEQLRHYQSACSTVILIPSNFRIRTIRRSCSVSCPFSSRER
ncbi:MAG: hypothetical protein M1483_02730 [Actinobacteria bacterium]|nr:hypothetical protein [Actinomycetota bacterium]MCL6104540.1 hypothetical protein [Actinomycetota bacterium]